MTINNFVFDEGCYFSRTPEELMEDFKNNASHQCLSKGQNLVYITKDNYEMQINIVGIKKNRRRNFTIDDVIVDVYVVDRYNCDDMDF